MKNNVVLKKRITGEGWKNLSRFQKRSSPVKTQGRKEERREAVVF